VDGSPDAGLAGRDKSRLYLGYILIDSVIRLPEEYEMDPFTSRAGRVEIGGELVQISYRDQLKSVHVLA
jgi:hypothetical protein